VHRLLHRVDLFFGVVDAHLPELVAGDVRPVDVVVLLHLDLGGEAVAVPPLRELDVVPLQALVPGGEVHVTPAQGVADVEVAGRIGRRGVDDVVRTPRVLVLVDVHLLPLLAPLRLDAVGLVAVRKVSHDWWVCGRVRSGRCSLPPAPVDRRKRSLPVRRTYYRLDHVHVCRLGGRGYKFSLSRAGTAAHLTADERDGPTTPARSTPTALTPATTTPTCPTVDAPVWNWASSDSAGWVGSSPGGSSRPATMSSPTTSTTRPSARPQTTAPNPPSRCPTWPPGSGPTSGSG